MKPTWVLLLVVGVVSADIGLGYHYKVPQTSYGVPSYNYASNVGQYSSGLSGHNSGYKGINYQNAGQQSASGSGSGYYQTSGASTNSGNVAQPIYSYVSSSGLGSGFQTQYSSSSQYQAAAQEKFQQQYQIQEQPAQVFKHFYVHAAPEEPEPPKSRTPIVLPPAQKHYKIIFVKTPSEYHRSQAVIPVQPQNEEKTIVYVLVKNPEEEHEVIVPKIEQKPPSKPEVYFIKYKNKDDPQAVINNIVKDYNNGEHVSFVNAGVPQNDFSSASGVSESSFDSASGFGNVQFDSAVPVQNDAATGTQSFSGSDNQGSGFSLSSANSGVDVSESNSGSTLATPLVVSSSASTANFDAGLISTSQGVPHETYGPPKFRTN